MHENQDGPIRGTMAGHESGYGMPSPWLDLAAAIVKTAADDYVRVLRKLWRRSTGAEDVRRTLTDIDPDRLIYQCRITAREKEKAAIARANRKRVKELLEAAE